MDTPVINGASYSWADIGLNLFARTVEGISAISYGIKQDKKNNYGRGNKPVSRGRGNKEYEGSITIELKEFQAIIGQLNGKSIVDIKPTDIPVVFANEQNILITHVLRSVEFLEAKVDTKQGDNGIEITLPLIIGDIIGL